MTLRNKRHFASVAGTVFAAAVAINAEIVQHGRCGASGAYVYVKNSLTDKPVKATIGVTRKKGDVEQNSQRIVRVQPGGEVRLGCSVGADLTNAFQVISTEP